MIKLKEKYKYALVVPTSMGVRLLPPDRQTVFSSDIFHKVPYTSIFAFDYNNAPTHILFLTSKDRFSFRKDRLRIDELDIQKNTKKFFYSF